MSLSAIIALCSVITLAFAIVYSERRVKSLRIEMYQRDECLRFAILVAAHRAADRPLAEKLESFVDDDEFSDEARRAAFELEPKDAEAREAA